MSAAEPSATEQKPLVFISAAHENYAWRNRLESKLDHYADQIEWWDDSKTTPGEPFEIQITGAIERASVAVVLFSNAYLKSNVAISELDHLIELAARNRLKLFPIALEPSPWREISFVQRIQVWNWTRPIDEVSRAASDELERIAKSIVDLARSTVHTQSDPSPELRLSPGANNVIEHAWLLGESSNRGRITSSCLLFALVEASVDQDADSRFIAQALNRNGRYTTEFQAFLKDGGPGSRPVTLVGVRWPLTANVSSLLNRAQDIADLVYLTPQDTETDEVYTRHLFAALINTRWDMVGSVGKRLNRLSIDLPTLRSEFREYLRKTAAFEDPVVWDELLGIERAEVKTTPGEISAKEGPAYSKPYPAFTPDRAAFGPRPKGAPLDDSLGVRKYASHLAQLIAARETHMPLSIGLFGSWGAGKSYFMDLLHDQLVQIADEAGHAFHKHIVQVHFNAWHYLDTSLWANLVSEIFDQLFAAIEKRGDQEKEKLDNLKTQLANQSALAAEADAALEVARNARRDAEDKLREAIKERAAQEDTVSTMLDDLMSLAIGNNDLRLQLIDAANGLGLPSVASSFNELQLRVEEMRSIGGRAKAIVLAVFTGPVRWKRAILLLAAVALPLAIAWLAANGGPRLEALFAGAGKYVAQFVTAIGFVAAWLRTQAKAGNALIGQLETAYDGVVAVRAQREATSPLASVRVALAQKQEAEEQARQSLRDAEEKLKNIQTELAEMAPGRQLIRFLRARATAEDYRRHLGLVNLVRKDFEQLSKLLVESETEDPKLPRIDRIVLYIDDLDRCRSDRVTEVLEAVHLLLAFPLFAVVVAVDPRWLRQSLLDHYPRLLGAVEQDNGKQGKSSLGRAATPQDYLEKIFQVPFNLQPMEKEGFDSLVNLLFPVSPKDGKKLPAGTEQQTPYPGGPQGPTDEQQRTEDPTKIPQDNGEKLSVQIGDQLFVSDSSSDAAKPEQAKPDPERLVLTQAEVKDVQLFQLLFETPRALKRFANTYSLIRVGVDKDEWDAYLGLNTSAPSYRVPLLLLAVTSAFPSLARPWLIWLRETPPAQWQLDADALETLVTKNTDTTDRADWEKLKRLLEGLELDGWTPPDRQILKDWVPRVARYSF